MQHPEQESSPSSSPLHVATRTLMNVEEYLKRNKRKEPEAEPVAEEQDDEGT